MIINYDTDTIREFLNHFNKITKLTINFWDNDINQLVAEPSAMSDFCRLIKSSPEGMRRCFASDKELCTCCNDTLKPATHKCHAGLVDTAVPIMFEDRLFGFIMFGQVKDPAFHKSTYEDIERLGVELNLPVDRLFEAYNRLYSFDMDIIDSASKILNAAMYYLYSSGCKITENELVDGIDKWIGDNLSSPVTVSQICYEFDISKNKLYSLWKSRFGVTIGDYILAKRMKKAKKLLLGDDLKIKDICTQVGIPDYNYFSRVFKKYYGISPGKYRKQYI